MDFASALVENEAMPHRHILIARPKAEDQHAEKDAQHGPVENRILDEIRERNVLKNWLHSAHSWSLDSTLNHIYAWNSVKPELQLIAEFFHYFLVVIIHIVLRQLNIQPLRN